ncbi:MAG: DMT family transporter [Gallionella sp.]|nr:DMT family transporter [Gallionella sp.]
MREVITSLLDVPFARMFVLAGIIFLIIAVMGKVEGKIDPGNVGRAGAAVLGVLLLFIGITMQYIEIRETGLERVAQQSRLQPQNATVAPVVSMTANQSGAAGASAAEKPAIKIVSGTYGRNCNGKAGNATPQLAKACDGKPACDYAAEPVELENAPANCARDFAAEWKCGSGSTVYSAILPADAGKNEKLLLACAG